MVAGWTYMRIQIDPHVHRAAKYSQIVRVVQRTPDRAKHKEDDLQIQVQGHGGGEWVWAESALQNHSVGSSERSRDQVYSFP